MRLGCSIITVIMSLMIASASLASVEVKQESQADYEKRMAWFDEAKLGLFVHFGIYATLGGEWKCKSVSGYAEWIQSRGKITPEEYIPLAANFIPNNFDADKWISDAKKVGMKYIVITTKHHDGFCLWDSAFTEYDTGEATTFDRDILAELSKACKKHGLKFGTYYSHIDWHHPSQRSKTAGCQTPMRDKPAYVKYMKDQLKELITKYDTDILWFDGDWTSWWTMDDGIDLYNYLLELKSTLIVNNRVAKRRHFKKDFGTPENSTPGGALDHRWEACWTVNHSWGYKISDTNWKSSKTLIQKQIDINAKGGNLLLNVGPKPDGTWPEGCRQHLLDMGKWNSAHKKAVYGSHFFEGGMQSWGRIVQANGSTKKKGTLYAIVFNWPKNHKLDVIGTGFNKVKVKAYGGKSLESSLSKAKLVIDLPEAPLNEYASVIRISYSGGLKTDVVVDGLELNGDEVVLQAKDSKLPKGVFRLENNSHIGYWTDPADKAEWDINIPAPGKYNVKLVYACDNAFSGSDVLFSLEERNLTANVKATASWTKFSILDLGTIKLDKVGNTKCSIGFGDKKGKGLFNLKTIVLAPSDN